MRIGSPEDCASIGLRLQVRPVDAWWRDATLITGRATSVDVDQVGAHRAKP